MPSDMDIDRMLSQRASSKVPLPPEISLVSGEAGRQYREASEFFRILGLNDHDVVRLLEERQFSAAVSETLSRATHLDRMLHFTAFQGNEPIKVVDLVGADEEVCKG